MSSVATIPMDPAPLGRPRSVWRDAAARLKRSRLAMACAAVVAICLAVGLLGFTPWLSGLLSHSYADSYEPPRLGGSVGLWMGTDIEGRSVLWKVLYGTRVALTAGIIAALMSALLGAALGIIAGYFGGWIDNLVIWLFSTVSSIPWILLMIALAYALKDRELSLLGWTFRLVGVPTIVLALGLTSWVGLCRIVRGEVLKLRQRDYVTAARAVGLGSGQILWRHILPNTVHLIIIDFTLNLVAFVQAEVVLSFLGLGVTDQPSWGRMIDDAKLEMMRGVWWQMGSATVAIFLLSLALNMLGDALRDALDPRLRGVD